MSQNPVPDFTNVELAFQHQPASALARAWISLQLCQWPWLVHHAPTLYRWSTHHSILKFATNSFLRWTLFGHFCGGEKVTDVKIPHGVGAILDYAAEHDDSVARTSELAAVETSESDGVEVECDHHLATFQQSIQASAALGEDGYVAVKVRRREGNKRICGML